MGDFLERAIAVSVVQVRRPVGALVLLDAAGSAVRGLKTVKSRRGVDVVRSGNSVTMTRDPTGVDDRIDPTYLDSSADHAPEGIDMAERQAEQYGQKGAVEAPHLDRL
jgi:hypothetical protein